SFGGRGGGGLARRRGGLLVAGRVALEVAGRGEFAELVADHVLVDQHRRVLLDAFAPSTFFSRCRSMNGPFFSERGMGMSLYLRRRTMNFCVRLLLRV